MASRPLIIAFVCGFVPEILAVSVLPTNHLRTPSVLNGTVALPTSLAIVADQCKCKFIGLCTCSATVEFMDCIADACASGDCACEHLDFNQSCHTIAGVCPRADLHCSAEKATCEHSAWPQDQTDNEIRAELAVLKRRKCKLQAARDAGIMNAELRLKELEPVIQGHLDVLKFRKKDAVYMGCTPLDSSKEYEISHTGGKASGHINIVVNMDNFLQTARAGMASDPDNAERSEVMVRDQIVYVVLVLLFALIYNHYRKTMKFTNALGTQNSFLQDNFTYGLFDCFMQPALCCVSCFCLPVRWADTLDKANELPNDGIDNPKQEKFLSFWLGLVLWLVIDTILAILVWAYISPFAALAIWTCFVIFLVTQRQKLRRNIGIQAGSVHTLVGDFFSWCCCCYCVAVQEAREVEQRKFEAAAQETPKGVPSNAGPRPSVSLPT